MNALATIVAAVAHVAVLSIAWGDDHELMSRRAFARMMGAK
jgi:hypothetical protein